MTSNLFLLPGHCNIITYLKNMNVKMTFAKMSAKLVVHKFEEGIEFKSLYITFGNDFSETTFSDWLDGTTEHKKKSSESSRLIIKLVSGSEIRYIDLDSCSKQILKPCVYSNYFRNIFSSNQQSNSHCTEADEIIRIPAESPQLSNKTIQNHDEKSKSEHEIIDSISPLEYSLEKVKENNARIMENIHMLNRTLNYTKKKEVLNVVSPCSKAMKTYPCNICGKNFVYITGLKRHYAVRHVMPDSQQRWQIVWTCTVCFQVWPCQDLALNHIGQCGNRDSADSIREIKTSSLLQCEFCEKVYTSIPRLLRHSKIHTTANNYECNACNMSFQSYKNAEQHWLFCPWLHMCYRFSLPKLLLCNACDRKFRNYEQLYNHRYKVGHFTTKLRTESDSQTSYQVYQCEICGEWCHTISLLQVHRKHYHPHYDTGVIYKTDN